MIKFKQDTQLDVVELYDEEKDRIVESSQETFKKGELVDAEIVSEQNHKGQKFVDLQFGGGGGLALGVERSTFTVVRD